MLTAEVVFQPSVFSQSAFPKCDFLQPGVAEQLLGDYEIESTFYSASYEIVSKPDEPGRYGAVVKITAEDGTQYTRFRTLYKTPRRLSLFFGRVRGELQIPDSSGVQPEVWHNQHQMLNDYVALALGRDINRSHDFAVLLAGLASVDAASGPLTHYESAMTADRKWWLKLKRKLNGNEERFADSVHIPRVVDGLEAPILREGTWEEADMKPDAVEKIDAVLQRWVADSDQPFNVCVARKGVLFFNRGYGTRDGKPVTPETKHIVFSISKALSGSLMMAFVDQGLVRLDDPVEKFLPEFANRSIAKPATIHHLFTHTADMEGHFTDVWNDLEHVYGEAYPHLAIGAKHKYNGTSIAIGLKVLEQLTGLTLPELYKKLLFDPLGCESIESIDGSAMTWSNARDLARVGQMLANHGAYGNLRFFSDETFEQMVPRKLHDLLGDDTDVVWGVGLTWFREGGLSDRTIGHGSASSCTLRVDLERDLVITMTRLTAGKNFREYHPQFIQAVTDGVAD